MALTEDVNVNEWVLVQVGSRTLYCKTERAEEMPTTFFAKEAIECVASLMQDNAGNIVQRVHMVPFFGFTSSTPLHIKDANICLHIKSLGETDQRNVAQLLQRFLDNRRQADLKASTGITLAR